MSLISNLRQRLFENIGTEAQQCKKVSDLDAVFDKHLSEGTAKQVKSLVRNRAAVESLLVSFTGDPTIGKKLDVIYQDKGKGGKR